MFLEKLQRTVIKTFLFRGREEEEQGMEGQRMEGKGEKGWRGKGRKDGGELGEFNLLIDFRNL